jgi:hypothetical protein
MSKYSNLPDAIIKIKLKKLISDDLSEELRENIKIALDPFDRTSVEILCFEAEKSIADRKKLLEEYRKNEAVKLANEKKSDSKTSEINDNDLKEIKKEFIPIVTTDEWTSLKNSMGVSLKDDNEIPIYSDLKSQFIDTINKSIFKLFKARYYDKSKYSEGMKFKFVNLNNGFGKEFEPWNKYCFTCFRLSINPETEECIYESWWIVNSPESMNIILSSDYEYFEIEDLTETDKSEFAIEFMKSSNPKYISECYLH